MRGKTITRAISRFEQLGGFRLVREYARFGILWKSIGITLRGLLTNQPPQVIYSGILQLVTPVIEKKYKPLVPGYIDKYRDIDVSKEHSNIIWFCWLQGLDNAPELVKKCCANLEKYLVEKKLIVIDDTTIGQYVTLPEIIVARWHRHQIPAALYSDIIRLELLIKYGGTWIDSTVLCTGANIPQEYLNSDLFLFQFKKPSESGFKGISNWFITSSPHHPLLMMIRDMLVDYWKEYDSVISFFIFHIFFSLIVDQKPDLIENMPYGSSRNSLFLEHHLGDYFEQDNWEKLISKVCFHKLTYRLDKRITKTPNTYYDMIVNRAVC